MQEECQLPPGNELFMNDSISEPSKGTSIRVRPLTVADIAFGMQLKQQAGWNQTEADWQRCLALEPEGCFVAELDGTPVGTTTTCLFGPVAWVAMVLVEVSVRGRGVGRALMTAALMYLESRRVRSIRLDATPLGKPLYEKLGFVSQFTLTRYDGVLPPAAETVAEVEPADADQMAEIAALDRALTGTDRRKLLQRLFDERPGAFRVVRSQGRLTGFASARPRAHALQMGPCLGSAEAGMALFTDTQSLYAGQRVVMDIPNDNLAARQRAEQMGLVPTRQLLRMRRGEPVLEQIENLWVSYGPEKG
jgi:GNAT superfamily N-acetyltransferase